MNSSIQINWISPSIILRVPGLFFFISNQFYRSLCRFYANTVDPEHIAASDDGPQCLYVSLYVTLGIYRLKE